MCPVNYELNSGDNVTLSRHSDQLRNRPAEIPEELNKPEGNVEIELDESKELEGNVLPVSDVGQEEFCGVFRTPSSSLAAGHVDNELTPPDPPRRLRPRRKINYACSPNEDNVDKSNGSDPSYNPAIEDPDV